MAARGQIPGVKLGKSWLFDETTLREWLQSGTRENIQPCPSSPKSQNWQIRFEIAGVEIRRSAGTSDRRAAQEFEEELRRELVATNQTRRDKVGPGETQ